MNLITGATGIIGSHVLLHLMQAGKPVVAGRRKSSDVHKVRRLFEYYLNDGGQLFNRITWREVDITDIFSVEDALEGIDHVFHCAGLVSFNPAERKRLFEINEKGTRNVVDACLHTKIKTLCHVSTIGTINNLDFRHELDESVFWKTSGKESDYALSKYNAEREVWRGTQEGLNAVIVNPGVVLSPGFWDQSSSRLFNNCYNGNKFYTEGSTGYIAAKDVARIMVELVEGHHVSNRYILVEENYSFRDIFGMIYSNFNKPAPGIRAGRALLKLAGYLERLAVIFTGKERIITQALINAALNKQTYSSAKVKSTLHTPLIPIKDALSEICSHYLSDRSKPQASV